MYRYNYIWTQNVTRQITDNHQIRAEIHNHNRNFTNTETSCTRRNLISHSLNELPPALTFFAGLGSAPYNLYRTASFDKLHVLHLGSILKVCDPTNTVLSRTYSLPLSRLVGITKMRFYTHPHSAGLSSHYPFRCSQQESKGRITGKYGKIFLLLVGLHNWSIQFTPRPISSGSVCYETRRHDWSPRQQY